MYVGITAIIIAKSFFDDIGDCHYVATFQLYDMWNLNFLAR